MKHLLPILALIAILPFLSAAEPEWFEPVNDFPIGGDRFTAAVFQELFEN